MKTKVLLSSIFHGRLGCKGMLNDVVSIHLVPFWCRLTRILRSPGRSEGLGPVKFDAGSDLLDSSSMNTLNNLLLNLMGLPNGLDGSLIRSRCSFVLFLCNLLWCGLLALGLIFLGCHSAAGAALSFFSATFFGAGFLPLVLSSLGAILL